MARMFYGWYKNDEEVLNLFKEYTTVPCTYVCFANYGSKYKLNTDGNMYFGFPANINITKLVNVINRNFKNIKIRIISNRILKFTGECSIFGDANGLKEFNYCLFKIDLNDKYTENSKFMLRAALAQFIRVYCPYYSHYKKMFGIKTNFINSALKAQETGLYGGWVCCDPQSNVVSRETFNKFDDIELVNTITAEMGTKSLPNINVFIRVLDGSKPITAMKARIWD